MKRKKEKYLFVVDTITSVEDPEGFPAIYFDSLFTYPMAPLVWKLLEGSKFISGFLHLARAGQIMELHQHVKK